MKKLLPLLVFLFIGFVGQAQQNRFEVKINPVAALFEVLRASVEYKVSDNFGAEIDVIVAEDVAVGYLLGKYYLSPKRGADKFYVDSYLVGGDGAGGLGFGAGYKLVAENGLVFDIGLGIGRDFVGNNDVLPHGKAQIGYRF